jgi:hypothetical protein|tara:strand:+ start:7307 stop:7447 length:141 start_codon:yes stop_codon:yes gene_type:complete
MKKVTVFLVVFLILLFTASIIFLTVWEIPAPEKRIEVILKEKDFLE